MHPNDAASVPATEYRARCGYRAEHDVRASGPQTFRWRFGAGLPMQIVHCPVLDRMNCLNCGAEMVKPIGRITVQTC
jgi:hypothetical protein